MAKIATKDRLDNASDEEAESLIAKATAAEFDLALDQVEGQAKSEKERQAISETRGQLRQSFNQAELHQRSKAEAARRRAEAYSRIGRAKTQEEADAIAAQYGELGQVVRRDGVKTQKAVTDVAENIASTELKGAQTAKTGAEALATEKKAAAGPELPSVPLHGYYATVSLPNQLQVKIGDGARALGIAQAHLGRLAEIAEGVQSGKISLTDATIASEIQSIRNGLVGQLTNINGAGAPTGKEYDDTIAGLADPQKFLTRVNARDALIAVSRNLQNGFDSGMRRLGVMRGERPANAPVAAPAQSANVTMIDPNGEKVTMPAHAAAALEKQYGYRREDESTDDGAE